MRHYASSLVIIASTLAFTATAPAQQKPMILDEDIGSNSCARFLGSVSGSRPGRVSTLDPPAYYLERLIEQAYDEASHDDLPPMQSRDCLR
jgi:hypothetical protein